MTPRYGFSIGCRLRDGAAEASMTDVSGLIRLTHHHDASRRTAADGRHYADAAALYAPSNTDNSRLTASHFPAHG
jgi:hypothetical protein